MPRFAFRCTVHAKLHRQMPPSKRKTQVSKLPHVAAARARAAASAAANDAREGDTAVPALEGPPRVDTPVPNADPGQAAQPVSPHPIHPNQVSAGHAAVLQHCGRMAFASADAAAPTFSSRSASGASRRRLARAHPTCIIYITPDLAHMSGFGAGTGARGMRGVSARRMRCREARTRR